MKQTFRLLKVSLPRARAIVVSIILMTLLSSCTLLSNSSYQYLSHKIENNGLLIETPQGEVRISALEGDAIEVVYLDAEIQHPSFAKKNPHAILKTEVIEQSDNLRIVNGSLTAVVAKSDLSVDYFHHGNLLTRQKSYFKKSDKLGFNFQLDAKEKLLGGGERVLGMNRRGHRMPLYNRAHYGYTTESNQMYFSLPMVMSDKKYAVLFDNAASGFLDIGKTQQQTLSFEAVDGRSAYIIFAGDNYPQLISHYVDVTGTQPLPPRWAFGNYASRFGYKSEQQVRDTVSKFIADDIPLDAVILDLYWFGPDIKGHVGNLDWDNKAFPTPQKMIDDLKELGIKTIVITEPFILSSSSNWQNAVQNEVLAKDGKGEPYRFDFYFGNTGLIDVFDDNASQWFWSVYEDLFKQGIAGTWGDLGEPEVHPDDILHNLSAIDHKVRGDSVHNAYGHQWAKLVYENQHRMQPEQRPFVMMRSGFAGSQRYGMIPWTGDVSREWGGLKPQVELSLQMGMLGMAYTHSDLGGFAGGEAFDKELYIRWLEYGVFQPVFRPHAQDHIPPEPVYHDDQTKDIVRDYIKLRYRMLPYLYTMAYQNSTTGMPLMRPLFFEDESNVELFDEKQTYLWGDSLLVSPVTQAAEKTHATRLPGGVWFDFWNGTRYQGDQIANIPVTLQTIPVLARAGSFIPMIDQIKTSGEYSSRQLELHYYADISVKKSYGEMYEDDGESFSSIEKQHYDLLKFSANSQPEQLVVGFSREGKGYKDMPEERHVSLLIHNWSQSPVKVLWRGQALNASDYHFDAKEKTLKVNFDWLKEASDLVILLN